MPARELLLPEGAGRLTPFTVPEAPVWQQPSTPLRTRVAFAAAHVVADPMAEGDPASTCALDWDTTLAYRHFLWSYGLGVAEAMDTAQRGMGLDWTAAKELIRRSAGDAKTVGGAIASGAGTDHLDNRRRHSIDAVAGAYEEQCAWVEASGSRVILMASRALAASAQSPDDYALVYGRVLKQLAEPAILHWLGGMFDPALASYWGTDDVQDAIAICLEVIRANRNKIDGIKLSLLDPGLEIEIRRRLPPGVRMYTGDDFAYPDLISGDAQGHSDALLGIFDAIAPAASVALQALDRGEIHEFRRVLEPTVPLSRTIFETPTYQYKTGIVFLSYVNGYQRHFRMVGGKESARSIVHLARVFRLAAEAGLLTDPDLAYQRMKLILSQSGVY